MQVNTIYIHVWIYTYNVCICICALVIQIHTGMRPLFLFSSLFILLERQRDRERERDLPPTGPLCKWLLWPELNWNGASSQELVLFLPCGSRGPRPSSTSFVPLQAINRELDQSWSNQGYDTAGRTFGCNTTAQWPLSHKYETFFKKNKELAYALMEDETSLNQTRKVSFKIKFKSKLLAKYEYWQHKSMCKGGKRLIQRIGQKVETQVQL